MCTEVVPHTSDGLVQDSRCHPVCRLTFSQFFSRMSRTPSSACNRNHCLGFPEEEVANFRVALRGPLIFACLAMVFLMAVTHSLFGTASEVTVCLCHNS